MIRIALVEDHLMFRQALKSSLEEIEDFKVVYEASCGAEYEKMYNPDDVDVTLLDLRLKGQHGSLTCMNLQKKYPESKIIILSQYDDPELILAMIRYGAASYITKDECLTRVEKILRLVMENGRYYDQNLGPMMLLEMEKAYKKKFVDDEFRVEFTENEMRIATLTCRGLTNEQIATEFEVSKRNIENHKNNMQLKVDCPNFYGVVIYMFKHYLLFPQQF